MSVMTALTSREPRQPRRPEKKRNTPVACPDRVRATPASQRHVVARASPKPTTSGVDNVTSSSVMPMDVTQ